MRLKIEFLHFEDCPNSPPTLKNLVDACEELGIDGKSIEDVCIGDLDQAAERFFLGSPSIYVNGLDLYTGNRPAESCYTCRIYEALGG